MISIPDRFASTHSHLPHEGNLLFCPMQCKERLHAYRFWGRGAGLSILSPHVAHHANCNQEPLKPRVSVLKNCKYHLRDKRTSPPQVGATEVKHTFFVCPDLGYDVILGHNFHHRDGREPNALEVYGFVILLGDTLAIRAPPPLFSVILW